MKPELKNKWIKALRGGGYQQATGVLRNDNGYCCLGVLCDVTAPDAWTEEGGEGRHHYGAENELSIEGLRVFGLSIDIERKLVAMNDDEKRSFSEIADYIDEHL